MYASASSSTAELSPVLDIEAGPTLCYNRAAFTNPELLVPDFSAFAGLRYDCNAAGADLEALTAPPYDVIDEDKRAALEASDPNNAVRLLLPRDRERDGDRYDQAARHSAIGNGRACSRSTPGRVLHLPDAVPRPAR